MNVYSVISSKHPQESYTCDDMWFYDDRVVAKHIQKHKMKPCENRNCN